RRPARVVAKDLRGKRDLDLARVEQGLAGAEALEPRHLIEVLRDEVAELPDDPATLGGGHPRPGTAAERLARGGDGEVDVAHVATADASRRTGRIRSDTRG